MDPTNPSEQPPQPLQPPSLARQAWNLARSLADFVADGCRTVSEAEYRERLEICDACKYRRDTRCMKCGCRLALKARGRAFRCPIKAWPEPEQQLPSSTAEPETPTERSAPLLSRLPNSKERFHE